MNNKTIANLLALVLGLAIFGGMTGASDEYYGFVGLGYLIVAIIAIVRLYKLEDAPKHTNSA